jgi:hypothetical protein
VAAVDFKLLQGRAPNCFSWRGRHNVALALCCAMHHSTSATGRLCCKSRGALVRSPKSSNIRLRKPRFLNQISPFELDCEKLFFPPGPKIVLQHYRSKTDSVTPICDVCSCSDSGHIAAPRRADAQGPIPSVRSSSRNVRLAANLGNAWPAALVLRTHASKVSAAAVRQSQLPQSGGATLDSMWCTGTIASQ